MLSSTAHIEPPKRFIVSWSICRLMDPLLHPALRQRRPVHDAGDDDLEVQQTTQDVALTYLH